MRVCALIALLLTFLLPPHAHADALAIPSVPTAIDGKLDLSTWDFATQGALNLDGEWLFYPSRLPEELQTRETAPPTSGQVPQRIVVPSNWNELRQKQSVPGFGYATYELQLTLPENTPELALRLTTVSSAFALYANGVRIAKAGKIGASPNTTQSASKPQVIELPLDTDTLTLRIGVANFAHARGGLWEPVILGGKETLQRDRLRSIAIAAGLASAALMLGLYHLFSWLLRREDYSALVFSLLCAVLAVRIISVNEILILELLPSLSYLAHSRIEYLSLLLLMTLALLFFRQVAGEDLPKRWLLALILPCAGYGLTILVAPVSVFSAYLFVVHILAVVMSCMAVIAIFRAIRRGLPGIWLYAFSVGLLMLVTAHDIVVSSYPQIPSLDLGVGDKHLVAFGFFAVLCVQALVLARRTATAMRELKIRSKQLTMAKDKLNSYAHDLETRVNERTSDLAAANTKLERLSRIDGLTSLYNRREFDSRLASAWAEHMRTEMPLSLALIDVDNFKGYNDRYGHSAGDDALIAIAQTLQSAVRRPLDLLARYGGEEFVVLLPNTDLPAATQLAERMRVAIEELGLEHADSVAPVVTISLGIACAVPRQGDNAGAIVDAADQAMYDAKNGGRNRVSIAKTRI